MPQVDERLSEAALIQVFEQARATSAGTFRQPNAKDPPDQRYIALITPERLICQLPTNRPRSMNANAVRSIEVLLPRSSQKHVVAIAFYEWSPSVTMRELSATIPFFGFLMGFAYIGHTVVVFEGHPSAFQVALYDADMLLVDADLVPFLTQDWMYLARQVMRTPAIYLYNRNSSPPVKRVVHELTNPRINRVKTLTAGEYHLRHQVRAAEGDITGALDDLGKALGLEPERAEFLIDRAVLRHKTDDPSGALADLEQALRLQPTNDRAYRERGVIYFAHQEWQLAIENFSDAIRLNPTNLDAYRTCAAAKIQKGDYAGAIADVEAALARLDALVGQNRIKQEDYSRETGELAALSDLARERILSDGNKPSPPTPAAPQFEEFMEFITSGRELFIAKQYNSAIRQFSRALDIDPGSVTALELRGKARIADKEYRGAVADFAELIDLAENNKQKAIFYNLRGQAHEHLKLFDEAADDFQQAIEADPEYIPAQENLEQLQRSGAKRRPVKWVR